MSEQYMVRKESDQPTRMSLPKNIRQMGNPSDKQKVYIEDYVYTYLHNFLKEKYKDDTLKAAVILGEYQQQDGVTYSFIKGAIACDFSLIHEQMSVTLTEQMETYFPDWELLGWYVSSQGVDSHIQSEIKHYYARNNAHIPHYLIYEDELERDIQVFAWEQNALHYLNGYYIYYEKNPQMQEFLIMEKGGRPQEMPTARTRLQIKNETLDVAKDVPQSFQNMERTAKKVPSQRETDKSDEFRTSISENFSNMRKQLDDKTNQRHEQQERARKKAAVSRTRKPQRLVYAACAAVLILLAAMGVSQMGNYQNLKHLQEAISNTFIPANSSGEDKLSTMEESPESAVSEDSTDSAALEGTAESNVSEDTSQTSPSSDVPETSTEDSEQNNDVSQPTDAPAGTAGEAVEGTDDTTAMTGEAAQPAFSDSTSEYYTVKKGDNLYSISRAIYENEDMVEQICQVNGITNVNLIFEGQKLKLP